MEQYPLNPTPPTNYYATAQLLKRLGEGKVLLENLRGKRMRDRVAVAHPVRVGENRGVTRNISASGVYFEVNTPLHLGNDIDFVIEFGRKNVNFILKCKGRIVRVENNEGKSGVAVSIAESVMESA
jgi:hypothetical protein